MSTNFSKILILLSAVIFLTGCKQPAMEKETINSYAIRLKPGEDLYKGIEKFAKDNQVKVGWISTCVGSLTDYSIRFANQPSISKGAGHFEIVSLTGTISENGMHLHISLSDSTGVTIGGHLSEGSKIYTTAEIVLLSTNKYEFSRKNDGTTPWDELQVKKKF
jgi:predicted DNA-binding protein with PD1-like motif